MKNDNPKPTTNDDGIPIVGFLSAQIRFVWRKKHVVFEEKDVNYSDESLNSP